MPQRRAIPFIGQTAEDRAVSVNSQETLNLQVEMKAQGAKSNIVLETIAGIIDRGAAGTGPLRTPQIPKWVNPVDGIERAYAVFGDELIAIDDTLAITVIGTLAGSSGIARIARGRGSLLITDTTAAYTYDGTTFGAITDPDFPTNFVPAGRVTHCVYLDTFFIINDADTDNFYISDPEDPTTWNALDFESAAVSPDAADALIASNAILYILGDETMQPYYNSGNADFPYDLYIQAVTNHGILAPQSIAESNEGVFYLGQTTEGGRFVVRIQGTTVSIISTDEIEQELATLISPTSAYGYIYQISGKAFYILQLDPNEVASRTLAFNMKSQTWETRAIQDGTAWRPAGAGIIGTRNIAGSRIAARLLELDLNTFQDSGQQLIRRRTTEIFHNNNHLLDWWEIMIDIDPGVGLATGNEEDVDPKVRMRYSDTGGKSWSSVLEEPIGKVGEFDRRAVFRNLGSSRNRIFEIEYSANTPFTVINAYAHITINDD